MSASPRRKQDAVGLQRKDRSTTALAVTRKQNRDIHQQGECPDD